MAFFFFTNISQIIMQKVVIEKIFLLIVILQLEIPIREKEKYNMSKKQIKAILITILTIVLLIVITGASWISTCGIIKLITMCFGWKFKWSIATGIWLVMFFIIKPLFRSAKSDK